MLAILPKTLTLRNIYCKNVLQPYSKQERIMIKNVEEHSVRKNILVIDDDEHIRNLLQEYLQIQGYNVNLARDGLEGMSLVEQENLDLVILDLKLPYVSGLGLVEIVHKHKPGLPIICITGFGSPKSLAEQEGCLVLAKPFALKDILHSIQKMLN